MREEEVIVFEKSWGPDIRKAPGKLCFLTGDLLNICK